MDFGLSSVVCCISSRDWSAAEAEHGWADACGQKACVHDCLHFRLQVLVHLSQMPCTRAAVDPSRQMEWSGHRGDAR